MFKFKFIFNKNTFFSNTRKCEHLILIEINSLFRPHFCFSLRVKCAIKDNLATEPCNAQDKVMHMEFPDDYAVHIFPLTLNND